MDLVSLVGLPYALCPDIKTKAHLTGLCQSSEARSLKGPLLPD